MYTWATYLRCITHSDAMVHNVLNIMPQANVQYNTLSILTTGRAIGLHHLRTLRALRIEEYYLTSLFRHSPSQIYKYPGRFPRPDPSVEVTPAFHHNIHILTESCSTRFGSLCRRLGHDL